MGAEHTLPGEASRGGWTTRPWWAMARRTFWTVFGLLTLVLIVRLGGDWDWAGAFETLKNVPAIVLWPAVLCAAISHLLYATYEMLGRPLAPPRRRAGEQPVAIRWMMAVGFVSFAFKLNLGTVVGGVALRYRLYERLGLKVDEITRILAASVLTNWLGYVALAGLLLLAQPPALPEGWGPGMHALRLSGLLMLASAVIYVLACWRAAGREWHWGRHALRLPSAGIALLQLALSGLHWILTAAVCWLLVKNQVDFLSVLNALLVSAVAGLITHVPGGLGVLEAVFIGLLQSRVGQADLLAALLGFRAIFYLLPLVLAVVLFFVIDRKRTLARLPTGS
jgi:glycosyltransferase 2 family protein